MSWFLAFVGFALLIILHELGHFSAAKAVGMRVERFSLFFPPLIARKKVGETEYAMGAIPLGGYVKISGMNPDEDLPEEVRDRAYHAQPVWKRIVVIGAGPAVNLVLAFVLLLAFFWLIGPSPDTTNVGAVQKGYPAAGVLQTGDKVVAVDGVRPKGDVAERQLAFSNLLKKHRCADGDRTKGCAASEAATVTFIRDGKTRTVEIAPIYDPAVKRNRLGFGYELGPHDPLPLGQALDRSADSFWFVTKSTLELPKRLFNTEQRKELSGVVGSYEVTRQTISTDFEQVIGILAIISLSLAIVNLFPFLPLDGGHIFWALVEKVRGKPVPLRVMERASVVGFMLVILIFAIGLTNDIGRLQGEGFGVR